MLKRIFILAIVIVSATQQSHAQTKRFSGQTSNVIFSNHKVNTTNDTLKPPSYSLSCYANQNILYYADYVAPHDSGFVTGNNIYDDLEKAQLYVNTQTVIVTGCLALVHAHSSGNTNINGTIKIYSKNTSTGNPQTLLATSQPILQTAIINNTYSTFTFNPPVTLSADFFVSYVLPQNAGDSIGIYSTYVTCHSPTTLAYEMAGGNIWGQLKTNWGFATGNDLDLALLPLIQNSSSGVNSIAQKNIFWRNDNSNLIFSETEIGAEISIINMQGQICKNEILQENKIDISQLSYGLYFFFLKDQAGILQKAKFIKQ